MKRGTAVVLAVVAAVVLTAGAVWAVQERRGQAQERSVAEVADQFQPPVGWVQLTRDAEPDRLLCVGGTRCPSVTTTYGADLPMGPEDFQEALEQTGWDLPVEGTCQLPANVTGAGPVCSAAGTVDGFDVYARQELTGGGGVLTVTVH